MSKKNFLRFFNNLFLECKKNFLILTLILLFFFTFLHHFSVVKNLYYLIKKDYYERLTRSYDKMFFSGFCSKESHGYIIFIKKNFSLNKAPKILNFDKSRRRIPNWIFHAENESWIFSNNIELIDPKNLIILNYDQFDDTKDDKLNLDEFKILNNYQNRCFYLEYKT